ncbi:hypothetical protein SAMN04515654_1287 [Halanaerobium congolense]|uniref:Uncharacterized protein n=1 Tax=Halanaerobium congolense TaxID=54121 RepID=A0A1G8R171_9FIRM|nr:hypothetical protein SAMN04515654_1287 [Halanaerobium congolense]SET65666.1 hypothetical protein SAMN04515653_12317 [Halanaerobium congolense]
MKAKELIINAIRIAGDVILVNLAFLLAFKLRFIERITT